MSNKKWLATAVVSMVALAGSVQAESPTQQPVAQAKAAVVAGGADAANDVKAKIQAGFHRVSKSLNIAKVSPTPIADIYLVEGGNGELLYASANGEYIFAGDMLKIKQGGLENLTDKVRGEKALKALSSLAKEDMIVYPAKGKTKRVMHVFTDVDCGYCRKLHSEIPALNEGGVEVRYLAFPRGGVQVPAYKKMVSAWCAKDRLEAFGKLKSGDSIADAECENPVLDQYKLGISLGVQGTPAIYLDDGQTVPGYRPAADILKIMGLGK